MRRRMKSCIALSVAVLLATAAAALIALSLSWREAADTPPSPDLTEEEQREIMESDEGDGYPVVDWGLLAEHQSRCHRVDNHTRHRS